MSASHRTHVCASVLAAAMAATPTARAFQLSESRWNPATLPISYRVNLESAPLSIGATVAQQAIDGGMASWSAPTCTRWRAVNAGTTTLTRGRTGDRENSFLWISGTWPAELGSVNVTIGVTTPVWTRGGFYIDADIQFNNVGFQWNTTGSRGVDTQSIATHEEGHFLGLDHTNARGAVMLASYPGGVVRALSSDDIAGVCALYPSGGPVPDAGTPPPPPPPTTDPCSRFTSCAGCTPVDGCGWCGALNRCLRSTSTGPIGTTCASGFAWVPMQCATTPPPPIDGGTPTDPCARYTSCNTCTPVNNCGWCGALGRCLTSVQTGPIGTTCASGFAWIPAQCSAVPPPPPPPPSGSAQFGEPCTQPGDCASGGLCVGSATVRPFCSRACIDDCTCPRGFTCQGRISTGQLICVPGTNTCSMTSDAGGPPPPSEDVPTTPTDNGTKNLADILTPEDAMTTKSDGGNDVDPLPSLPGSSRSGCGCHVPGTPSSRAPWSLIALALGAVLARRRRS